MYGVCIEASHARGLGHLYRALNLLACLEERGEPHVVLLNDYSVALGILRERRVAFEIVPLDRVGAGWEADVIRRHRITTWINDRLATDIRHSKAVKREGARLVTFDDPGSGAGLADLHVAALCLDRAALPGGRKVVTGTRYLVLNRDIERYRRLRTMGGRIAVTLGGTDTYGVTVKVVAILRAMGVGATVIIGPGFDHRRELDGLLTPAFEVKQGVPSLIEEFSGYDLAVTGGGITAFEAAASGLPCVVVANEWFEVAVGEHLERAGCAVFAGHHSRLGGSLDLPLGRLESMSRAGMASITTEGAANVCREIGSL